MPGRHLAPKQGLSGLLSCVAFIKDRKIKVQFFMSNNYQEYFLNQERLIHVDAVKGSGGPVQTYLVSFVTSVFPGNVGFVINLF